MGMMFPISTHMYLKYGVKRNPDAPRTIRNIMMSTAAAGDSLHAVEWWMSGKDLFTLTLGFCPGVLFRRCSNVLQNSINPRQSTIIVMRSLKMNMESLFQNLYFLQRLFSRRDIFEGPSLLLMNLANFHPEFWAK